MAETLAKQLLREERERQQEAPQEPERQSTSVVDIVSGDRVSRVVDRRFHRGGGVHVDEPAKPGAPQSPIGDSALVDHWASLSEQGKNALRKKLIKVEVDSEPARPLAPATDAEMTEIEDLLDAPGYFDPVDEEWVELDVDDDDFAGVDPEKGWWHK